jgi:hypothetical protein
MLLCVDKVIISKPIFIHLIIKKTPGIGSSRTVLVLEDTSRIKFGGLGLELVWPWPRCSSKIVPGLKFFAAVRLLKAVYNVQLF